MVFTFITCYTYRLSIDYIFFKKRESINLLGLDDALSFVSLIYALAKRNRFEIKLKVDCKIYNTDDYGWFLSRILMSYSIWFLMFTRSKWMIYLHLNVFYVNGKCFISLGKVYTKNGIWRDLVIHFNFDCNLTCQLMLLQ